MDPKNSGMRRYLYEYVFHQSIEAVKERGTMVMVSDARAMRSRVEAKLVEQNLSMDDPTLRIPPVLAAIDETLAEAIPDHEPLFAAGTGSDPTYQAMSNGFMHSVGLDHKYNGVAVAANPGPGGPRLPISPYDNRWASRATVKQAGSQLRFVLDQDVKTYANNRVSDVAEVQDQSMQLYSLTDDARVREAGSALSLSDLSGLTELMGRMSVKDYNAVRDHLIRGGVDENGELDSRRYMSPQALERATAILDDLASRGVGYTVRPDIHPGQLKVQLNNTSISVRLTDIRSEEHYVGRVYDAGVSSYFMTSQFERNSSQMQNYTPTVEETLKLLHLAEGLPVQRSDGRGLVGAPLRRRRGSVQQAEAFYPKSKPGMTMVLGDLVVDGQVQPGRSVTIHRDAGARSTPGTFFSQAESGQNAATTFLTDAVRTASEAMSSQLQMDALVEDYRQNQDQAASGDYFPPFSGNPEIAAIQRSYWDFLRGEQQELLAPGFQDIVEEIRSQGYDEVMEAAMIEASADARATLRTDETEANIAALRDHSRAVVEHMIGDYNPEMRIAEFDPARVARFMDSEYGSARNSVDLVRALKALDANVDGLRGDAFALNAFKDRLITFDEGTGHSIEDEPDEFRRAMMTTVSETISRNACEVTDLRIDDAGVISWTANRVQRDGGSTEVRGQIGQVFPRGEYGEVVTSFASTENYMFVPGYEARIAAQRPGERKTVEERTILRGYEQQMSDQIQYQVTSDLLNTRWSDVGDPTSLNRVYRGMYDIRHDRDFLSTAREAGLDEAWIDAILRTEARRVRYGNEIADGSTVFAAWQAENGGAYGDPANDNMFNAWTLTGGRNMAIMSEESDGYFDPIMTNGSKNQGVTRYLTEGAQVNADGTVIPGPSDDRAPLMKHEATRFMDFDPYDRQQMTSSNLLTASAVVPGVTTAMMTFGGWTADDPVVISQRFAATHQIMGVDGQMRDLVPGDKLSDLHGNKGVISLVVDPQMNPQEAREQQLETAVQVFRENPELDVVMSPFSAVSRFNGGTARELMESPKQIMLPSGETVPAAGEMNLIVTRKSVDAGTHIYDDEALAAGQGRKASSQLAWALGSQNCEKVMAEFYGPNNAAMTNLREMAVVMGLDVSPDGTLREGYDEMAAGASRQLFSMPELRVRVSRGAESLDWKATSRDFVDEINQRGGDMELPFSLTMPTGRPLPAASDAGTYKLPVLSAHLRSGRELADGMVSAHDYTNHYMRIQEAACRYRFAQEQLATGTLDAKRRAAMEKSLAECPDAAQSAYNAITRDLKDRKFQGKHNVFKESVMASRLPNSATAVWTSDPRLDVNKVAMSTEAAAALGLSEGDHAIIWRDPILRDSGLRYMEVAIDDRLTGVAINPVMDKCFDGDFDGDSVAVVRLTSKAAQAEAMDKLSVEANLLDVGQRLEDGTYPLAMQDSLDTKVSEHADPELAQRLEDLRMRANEVYADEVEDGLPREEAMRRNRELVGELSEFYRDALGEQYGGAYLRFDSTQNHVQSVIESCVETGAKGSMSKVGSYCRYLGVDPQTYEDHGQTDHTREDDKGVMMATAVKSHGTGIAGAFSQRGVKALRNDQLKAVLELTYPVTQSVLQSKHDPEEARQKYEMMMGPARALWQGHALVKGVDDAGQPTWSVAVDEKKNPIQADVAMWKSQFEEFYTSKSGLNVAINPEHVELVAQALSDDGVMRNIEEKPRAGVEPMGSTMDRLAYGGSFDTMLEMAGKKANLFEGHQNAQLAPYAVRSAAAALMDPEAEEPAVAAAKDVQHIDPAKAHSKAKRSPLAQARRSRPNYAMPVTGYRADGVSPTAKSNELSESMEF